MGIKWRHGRSLPVQLHLRPTFAGPPACPKARPAEKASVVERMTTKPSGGMWSSSLDLETGNSAWLDYVSGNREWMPAHRLPENSVWWVFKPADAARVLIIESVDDYLYLSDRFAPTGYSHTTAQIRYYVRTMRGISAEKVLRAGFVGLSITEAGVASIIDALGPDQDFYDVESSWWGSIDGLGELYEIGLGGPHEDGSPAPITWPPYVISPERFALSTSGEELIDDQPPG